MSSQYATTHSILHTLDVCAKACIDGHKGYLAAAKDVRDPELRSLFEKYADERAGFIAELEHLIESFGGAPVNQGTVKGTAHRGFLDARVSMEGATDAVLLGECERGELAAIAAYDRAFGRTPLDTLPGDVRQAVVGQRGAIRAAYDDIAKQDVSRRRAAHGGNHQGDSHAT
jgi:uncharacterized protein (TIGR02284 family)